MKRIEDMVIHSNMKIAENIYEMILRGTLAQEISEPGQFVNIAVASHSKWILRRPLSICETDENRQEIKIVYRAEGDGTTVLSEMAVGNTLNVFGPLGRGFPLGDLKETETALIIGGGIGIPPLYELAKKLSLAGVKVISVLGYADSRSVFYEKKFLPFGEVFVTTMDGSLGFKGNVLEFIKNENIEFDVLYACGPKTMLKAIQAEYRGEKRGYISIEERMACGIGACYGCVCDDEKTHEKVRVCKEGPVFPLDEVIL